MNIYGFHTNTQNYCYGVTMEMYLVREIKKHGQKKTIDDENSFLLAFTISSIHA